MIKSETLDNGVKMFSPEIGTNQGTFVWYLICR